MIDHNEPDYTNTPAAPGRPRLGFAAGDPDASPVVSIVTPFYRSGPLFRETVESVLRQSLQQWEWIVVDDASGGEEDRSLLEEAKQRDPRIRVVTHPKNRGRSAARNTGIGAAVTEFIYLLDQDDLIEPTTLEKCLWCLASHPDWGFANGWSVTFGSENHLWSRGFERGDEFLEQNGVTGRVLVRRETLASVGFFDETIIEGFEDWDLWLRCASQGTWGGTLPEYLDWFRRRELKAEWERPERLEGFRTRMKSTYPALYAGFFPEVAAIDIVAHEEETFEWPCSNTLAQRDKRALILLFSLSVEGSGALYLEAVKSLTRAGWQISLVSAFDGASASAFGEWTADIYVMNHFLSPSHQPEFLAYLIGSRRPEVVLAQHCLWSEELLTHVHGRCPEPSYVGLCHRDPDDLHLHEVNGMPNAVDLVLVTTEHLRRALLSAGTNPARVLRLRPGVDTTVWGSESPHRKRLRSAWDVSDTDTVILVAGRLSSDLRTNVMVQTLRELDHRGVAFRAVVHGNGDRRRFVQQFLADKQLEHAVTLLDLNSKDRLHELMMAADVFFLPVRMGSPLSSLRALASGLPVVSADIDGHGELVDSSCGVLIETGDDASQVRRYADVLESLARSSELRGTLARGARARACRTFSLEALGHRLDETLAEARALPRRRLELPDEEHSLVMAIQACRTISVIETLRRERDELAQRLSEQEILGEETSEAHRWFQGQRDTWKELTAEGERTIGELRDWIEELETARCWHEEQRAGLLARVEELDGECRRAQERLAEIQNGPDALDGE